MLPVAVLVGALIAFAAHVAQKPAASVGSESGRGADRAAIETLRQQDIAATLSRDPVALTDLWTDDAIRLGPGQPAEVGKQAIRESNERWSTLPVKMLTFVPETKDLRSGTAGQSSGGTSRVRMSNCRLASPNRFVARGSGCSGSSRTAAGNTFVGWVPQLLPLAAR